MCHLFLLLPIIALPVFWLLPFPVALPIYAAATAVALVVYGYAMKAMHSPRLNGAEALIGAKGRIVEVGERGATLRLHGELWTIEAGAERFAVGDTAVVTGIEGLRLKARAARVT